MSRDRSLSCARLTCVEPIGISWDGKANSFNRAPELSIRGWEFKSPGTTPQACREQAGHLKASDEMAAFRGLKEPTCGQAADNPTSCAPSRSNAAWSNTP